MHDKLALYPWYILRINPYKRLIYKSLNIIALFAHFKGYFHLFCNKKRDELSHLCFRCSSPATKRLELLRHNANNCQIRKSRSRYRNRLSRFEWFRHCSLSSAMPHLSRDNIPMPRKCIHRRLYRFSQGSLERRHTSASGCLQTQSLQSMSLYLGYRHNPFGNIWKRKTQWRRHSSEC